ncbi:unnamed protein product [Discosporangium mesarthrocarpum]
MSSYPLDTIKTRLQSPGLGDTFKSPLECFLTTVREDGARALYRGVSSRMAAAMITNSVMFGANGTFKEILGADTQQPTSVPFMAAAAATGVVEAVAYSPLELVKTRMQVMRGSRTNVTTWSTAQSIYHNQGLYHGLYRGLSAMTVKETLGNMVYFCSYETSRQALTQLVDPSVSANSSIVIAGGLAGLLYTSVVHPIDTLKSLLQTDSMGSPQYHGLMDCLKQTVARGGGGLQGFLTLYRGLTPNLTRSFVGNAALFLVFEKTMDALGR